MKPLPVIAVTATTQVTLRAAPWRRWVTVRRGFARELCTTYIFDPQYKKLATGAPLSGRWTSDGWARASGVAMDRVSAHAECIAARELLPGRRRSCPEHGRGGCL